MNRTLLQINDDGLAVDALVQEYAEQHDGDVSGIADIIDGWIKENSGALNQKLEGYVAVIREYEARAAAREAEATRIVALARTDKNQAAHLRARLKFYFEQNEISKIETATAKISLVNNGGKLPVIIDEGTDPRTVPAEYRRVTVEIDKKAVAAALESNTELPFAKLGERGKSLRIK